MSFRTLALALALACGLTAAGEAKTKPVRVATSKGKNSKAYRAMKANSHKAKHAKRPKMPKNRH